MAMLEKTALNSWKKRHALHVLLIETSESVSKAVAEVQAYHEGVEGLAKRQAPPAPTAPKGADK